MCVHNPVNINVLCDRFCALVGESEMTFSVAVTGGLKKGGGWPRLGCERDNSGGLCLTVVWHAIVPSTCLLVVSLDEELCQFP
jgi:hypothetical protein